MRMDNTDYQILKNKILLQPTVYREVDKNEIVAVDETHYRVGNAVVEFSPEMAEDMDRFVGLKMVRANWRKTRTAIVELPICETSSRRRGTNATRRLF